MDHKPCDSRYSAARVPLGNSNAIELSDFSGCLPGCAVIAMLIASGASSIVSKPFGDINGAEWAAVCSFIVVGLAAIMFAVRLVKKLWPVRYNLKALVLLTAIGPPFLAGLWFCGPYLPAVVMGVVCMSLVLSGGLIIVALLVAAALSVPLLIGWAFSLMANGLIRLLVSPENRR